MDYSKKEKKILKKLGIEDFRHMTKEKVVKFAPMLHEMDAEVAKKALEQFPSFKELAAEMIHVYSEKLETIIKVSDKSMEPFYNSCNSTLEALQWDLKREDLTPEQRGEIEDKMIQVVELLYKKDTEQKEFLKKIFRDITRVVACVLRGGFTLLGVKSRVSDSEYDEDEEE